MSISKGGSWEVLLCVFFFGVGGWAGGGMHPWGVSDEDFCWQTSRRGKVALVSTTLSVRRTKKRQQNCTTVFAEAIRNEEAKKHLRVDILYSSNSRGLGPHYIHVLSSTSARQKLWAHRATAIPLKSPRLSWEVFPPLGSARPCLSPQERLNKPTPTTSFFCILQTTSDLFPPPDWFDLCVVKGLSQTTKWLLNWSRF